MKKTITIILVCLITVLLLTGCITNTNPNVVSINIENDTAINGNTFGKSTLIEIGDGLYYDSTTRIVYWWNGWLNIENATTPSPYYAPNGFPYRYNPKTNTFKEIKESENK